MTRPRLAKKADHVSETDSLERVLTDLVAYLGRAADDHAASGAPDLASSCLGLRERALGARNAAAIFNDKVARLRSDPLNLRSLPSPWRLRFLWLGADGDWEVTLGRDETRPDEPRARIRGEGAVAPRGYQERAQSSPIT